MNRPLVQRARRKGFEMLSEIATKMYWNVLTR